MYELLEDGDAFDREYVVHGNDEYADDEVHVNSDKSLCVAGVTVALAHGGVLKDKLA